MGVRELLVVRHAESTANVARDEAELTGGDVIAVSARDADVVLSDLGIDQAASLGRWLAQLPADQQPQAVWCSPYTRARQTAQIALDAAGSPLQLHIDERLRDRELGVLDMLTSHGVRNRFPAEAERRRWLGKFYYRPPGGESWPDIALRLRSLLADLDRVEDGRRVLVVTHDAVVLLLRYVCEGLDEQSLAEIAASCTVANTGVTRFVRAEPDGPWTMVDFNRDDHLDRRESGASRREHAASKADVTDEAGR